MNDDPIDAAVGWLMRPVGMVSAAFWGAGTNLLSDTWYVAHGISVGDGLFAVWMLLALCVGPLRRGFLRAAYLVREHLALMGVFILLLLTSTAYNTFRFGSQWSDLFAIARLAYFSLIIVFTVDFVLRYSAGPIVAGFVVGVAAVAAGRVFEASLGARTVLFGWPLLSDPNVIGNMLGVGTFMTSLVILEGWLVLPLVFAVLFAVTSALTFSKGAWLMVAVGLAANAVALKLRYALDFRGLRRLVPGVAALVLVLGIFGYQNAEKLTDLWSFKLFTTTDSGTADYRYRFALAGTYAMLDYPVFGLGFRNFGETLRLYPEVMPEPSENAHNAFVQVGAVAGLPALAVLLILFIYPFPQLWPVVRGMRSGVAAPLFVVIALILFAASGAVQLQLIAQPFFWVFTGVVRGWRCAAAAAPIAPAGGVSE